MRVVAKMFLVGLLGAVVMLPIPETIIGLGRLRRLDALVLLAAAFTVSMLQLGGEYWLVGQARDRVRSYVRLQIHAGLRDAWETFRSRYVPDLSRYRPIIRPVLEAGGYATMIVGCLNPIPMTPISRMAAVTIWRTTKLPWSMSIVVVCSFVKYAIIVAGTGLIIGR